MNTYQYTIECRVRTCMDDALGSQVYMSTAVILDELTAKERPSETDIIELILNRKDNKQILSPNNKHANPIDTYINGIRVVGLSYYCNRNQTYCVLNVTSIQKVENKKSGNFSKTFD